MNHRLNHVHVVAVITALCLTGDSMLYVVLPFYWHEAGLHSLLEAGILLSVNRLVRLPLGPLAGWLLQKVSVKRGLWLAVVLASVTTAAYGFAHEFWIWLLLRCLWGFTWSLLRLGALFVIAGTSNTDEHGKNMGTYNGLYRLGSLAGMLLGGLIAQLWGLLAASLLFGTLAILSLFLLPYLSAASTLSTSPKFTLQGTPSNQKLHRDFRLQTHEFFSNGLLLILGTGAATALLYQGIFAATLSHVVDTRFNAGLSFTGITIGAVSLAGFLSAIRWGWEPFLAPFVGTKSDRSNQGSHLLTATLLCAAPLFALVPVALPPLLWLGIIIAIQLSATALTTLADATASQAAAPMPSGKTFLTLYSVLQDTGAALGPLLGYLLPVDWLFRLCALLLLGLAACWYGKKKNECRKGLAEIRILM